MMNDPTDELKETEQVDDEMAATFEPELLSEEPVEDGDGLDVALDVEPDTEEVFVSRMDRSDLQPEPHSLETAALEIHPDLENPLFNLSKAGNGRDAGEQTMIVAKRCFLGAVRDRNEDSCLVFTSETGGHFPILPFGLYVVADGMGGHKNGHIASKTAARIASRQVIERVYLPLLQVESVPSATPIVEILEDAVEAAHRALYDPTE